jgi:hypothetical protein
LLWWSAVIRPEPAEEFGPKEAAVAPPILRGRSP